MTAPPRVFSGPIRFEWDSGNEDKNWVRHGVRRSECEEIFACEPLLVLDDPRHSASERRYLALGGTRTGRWLFVSFTLRGERLRVISARDMSRRERRSYAEAQAEGDPDLR